MNFRKRAFMTISKREALEVVNNCEDKNIVDKYGMNVFNEKVMRERLPKYAFNKLQKMLKNGEPLDLSLADIVANTIKDWAVSKGATHYTHWFQSMTGATAEKHDSFTSLLADGQVISEFSGKMLIKGEPDASSFPSGGIRSTFEARGYTAWDPTSPVFISENKNGNILYIPTVFISYTGECLDRKIPLLKSVAALSTQALRVLKLFGSKSKEVINTIGAEQEYFLIDREFYLLRPDLYATGRTLYGAKPPKGQELDDHYFGAIPSRVLAFMEDAEERLIKLGVPAKTRHNEVAPMQFELASIYEQANIASDHNLIIMNVLKDTAKDHNFECLLHEKPFAYVNGSGKHNNWSMADDEGNNLLEPGNTPEKNIQFLVFLTSIIRALHKYPEAFRLGTVCPGNDHRLGANEAPPAIMSVFLGSQLMQVVDNIVNDSNGSIDKSCDLDLGVITIPKLPKDATDRNRTSPMAFTGNKFEFRAQGASQSIAQAIFVMNAAIIASIDDIATDIESYISKGDDVTTASSKILKKYLTEHYAVIYNGDNYSTEWYNEASKRGLPNYPNVVESIRTMQDKHMVELFSRYNILTASELPARQEILYEKYIKTISIEARSTSRIGRNNILPVAIDYHTRLSANIIGVIQSGISTEPTGQKNIAEKVGKYINQLCKALDTLDESMDKLHSISEYDYETAKILRDKIVPLMNECRANGDALELLVDDNLWTLPTYQEMLWIN